MAKLRPKPRPRNPLMVRIPADLVDRIDNVRGGVPREAFIREALTSNVHELEQTRTRLSRRTRR